jgi:hypothetical protein
MEYTLITNKEFIAARMAQTLLSLPDRMGINRSLSGGTLYVMNDLMAAHCLAPLSDPVENCRWVLFFSGLTIVIIDKTGACDGDFG